MEDRSTTTFVGRRAVLLATRGEERAILPVLVRRLSMFVEVLHAGVERSGSPEDVLRAKLSTGRALTPYDGIIVASEESVNRVLVGLLDPESGVEIVGTAAVSHDGSDARLDAIARACEDAVERCTP